jgi:sugar phosphate permease
LLPPLSIKDWDKAKIRDNVQAALSLQGYPMKADTAKMNIPLILALMTLMMIFAAMVYGPMAALLVEQFPARIRYTSLSLPYHLGNGWFGGLIPLMATALVASSGNIFYGLWFPVIVALMTFVVGFFFLKDEQPSS